MEVNSKSGSNLTKVMWAIEIWNAAPVVSKSPSKDGNGGVTKVSWRIPNSPVLKRTKSSAPKICVDGNKWRIDIYPKGNKNKVDHLSIFLTVADSATLSSGWTTFAQYAFAIIDQIDRRNSIPKVGQAEFNETKFSLGGSSFLALAELQDPERGYLVNDACLVEAYISTPKIEPAIDHEEPTKEDMNTFFSTLESTLSSFKIGVSQEDSKEALAKLDEAMNMAPLDFYNSGKFPQLKQAFKILASFNYSSTTLTVEQKNVLLAMEESLKELADRAAKATEDKKHVSEMESMKLTITHSLNRSLVRYKEVESEVKLVDQKLAAFHEQVEEAQKARENMLAEQKGIFRSSKRMKVELEALKQNGQSMRPKPRLPRRKRRPLKLNGEE